MIHAIYFWVESSGKLSMIINDDNPRMRRVYAIGDKINGATIIHFTFINNTVILSCDDGNDYFYDDHFQYEKSENA